MLTKNPIGLKFIGTKREENLVLIALDTRLESSYYRSQTTLNLKSKLSGDSEHKTHYD